MRLSGGSVFQSSWETYKQQPVLLTLTHIGLGVLFLLIGVIFSAFYPDLYNPETAHTVPAGVNILMSVVFGIVGALYFSGTLNVVLFVIDENKSGFDDILASLKFFPRILGVTILFSIPGSIMQGVVKIGSIGVILWLILIIPYIIFCLHFMFAPYFVIDRDMGVFESFGMSGQITSGRKWELFLCLLVIIIFNTLIIVFTCSIGLLVALPLYTITYATAYRILSAPHFDDMEEEGFTEGFVSGPDYSSPVGFGTRAVPPTDNNRGTSNFEEPPLEPQETPVEPPQPQKPLKGGGFDESSFHDTDVPESFNRLDDDK